MKRDRHPRDRMAARSCTTTCVAAAAVTPRWFVLHTRSRQEKAVAADLAARGVSHFLPLQEDKGNLRKPIYPGYVFLFGEEESAYPIDRNRRLVRIIPVVDQQHLTWELTNLRQVLERGIRVERHGVVDRGVRVEVQTGPLRGIQGIVENVLSSRRLVLQVEMLGQATAVEVDAADLAPLDPPTGRRKRRIALAAPPTPRSGTGLNAADTATPCGPIRSSR